MVRLSVTGRLGLVGPLGGLLEFGHRHAGDLAALVQAQRDWPATASSKPLVRAAMKSLSIQP